MKKSIEMYRKTYEPAAEWNTYQKGIKHTTLMIAMVYFVKPIYRIRCVIFVLKSGSSKQQQKRTYLIINETTV